MEAWEGTAKLTLRDAGVRYRAVSVDGTTLTATFGDQVAADAARAPLRQALDKLAMQPAGDSPKIVMTLNETAPEGNAGLRRGPEPYRAEQAGQ